MPERNVLIVDDEKALIQSIESGFEPYRDRFNVLTAENGRAAIGILEARSVDLVVTDLRMPVMDGLELLVYMNKHFPNIPASVITAFRTVESERLLKSMGVLSLLDKPVAFDDLVECVEEGLRHKTRGGALTGVSVSGFLQLIEMERKTCRLEVRGPGGVRGHFSFVDGVLYDAVVGDLCGEEAALTMIGWDDVRLRFKELASRRKATRRIRAGLMKLLMEGLRRKDEAIDRRDGGKGATGPRDSLDRDRVEAPVVRMPERFRTAEAAGTDGGTTRGRKQVSASRGGEVFTREEMMRIGPGLRPSSQWIERSRTRSSIGEVFEDMAEEMDDILLMAVFSLDGSVLAAHSPSEIDVDIFAAKFALLLKLAGRATEELEPLGRVEENLIQTRSAWVLTRWLGGSHFLGIVARRDGNLGSVRLAARKYQEPLCSFFGTGGE